MTPPTVVKSTATPSAATAAPADAEQFPEDARTQRRRLARAWAAPGSAVAAMVALSWYIVVRNGSQPPGGDMIGHAAAAEWLRTLPWWDWRGWSDWFYGGQAIGVNYPPLGHAWMRFTHPAHGQMVAVAVGLLVLLPWGVLRLARAVGYGPRAQRAAVGGALLLTAASGQMHWVLSGFHQVATFFGSWPTMLATVLGLFCAAWAACCRRPVACGVVGGIAILFNVTTVPGIAVVSVALLATSGASFRQAVRWGATAGSAGLAACAWWLVPFLAGWDRLVRWKVPLSTAWNSGGTWQVAILAVLGAAAALAARSGVRACRRLALAGGLGLLATLSADLFGYLRPERWLQPSILMAVLAGAGLVASRPRQGQQQSVRPAWGVLGVAFGIVLVVITGRLEFVPLAAWLLWWPRRTWAAAGAVAWAAVLMFIPFWSSIRDPVPPEPPVTPLEAAAAHGGPNAEGLVDLAFSYNDAAGDVANCAWGHPWRTTADTGGRIRPLTGLYRETSHSAEFVVADQWLRGGSFREHGGERPHWFDAWQSVGGASLDNPRAAAALGARWYARCDEDGNVSVAEVSGPAAGGVPVAPHAGEDEWHKAAVEWWVSLVASAPTSTLGDVPAVPVLSPGETAAHPVDQAASGVSLHAAGDSLTVSAERAGWAWLRVPWDPNWRSLHGTPVRKGGPGHLVVWAEEGDTELRWFIPGGVDVAAGATTGAATAASAVLALVNRRRGFEPDPDRRRPAAEALAAFADTVDGWARALTGRARACTDRLRRMARP